MDRRSRTGTEPTTMEAVGDQWRYALVVVQAGDDDVIMTEVIASVHSVHLVNVEQRQAPTLRLSHLTSAVSPPVGSYRLQPPSPFITVTQPES